ncbi:hypothetical protein EPMMONJG_00516 [Mannheimia haemolytica]|nr:hypothetical protein F382_02635 [Mannheimia haemolytica D153]AGQ40496.1 hypothetical protein J451_02935 [Mannheimia haemolytica D174]AGR75381.1 hypothetical protein N220_08725 [Mannheimia haemolytica USMARC_2286]EPZ02550.1 hypothetical protein L279_08565 [Mannheimia haemolytica D38]EPZ27883.1 hypothetical protein L280_12115 [Mannheimia haemolytica MhBrain2012]EPZ29489.1 hypothetical protein L281_08625 [Mannheimia haemolytica MhSwine2000]EPZ29856.1 hypothetical protein L277_09210 [Mannheimi
MFSSYFLSMVFIYGFYLQAVKFIGKFAKYIQL